MISKIIFTIAVIAAVVLTVQMRKRRATQPASVGHRAEPSNDGFRWLAYFAVLLMLLGSAIFMYLEWREQTEIVALRVVDASSGRSVTYQAYRSDIDETGFRTTDGRRIMLARTERLEVAAEGTD